MDESGNQCIICQDAWTSSGPHQLCCLACGHLFGFACISKWLGSLPKTQGYCPQCHAKAAIKDVRTLYCPTDLASRDSSREEAIRRELARERAERAAAEAEAARATLRADQVQRKLDALTESLHQQVAAARLAPAKARRALHAAEEEEEDASTPDAPAAVCAYQVPGGKSLLFQASWAIVGSGQGQQFTLSFVHPDRPDVVQAAAKLHAGVIRDLASSADGRVVATASLDGTCKLVSSVSQNQVLSVALGEPAWSVALEEHVIHAGTGRGRVVSTDSRFSAKPLFDTGAVAKGPVHSLAPLWRGAVAAASFNGLWACEIGLARPVSMPASAGAISGLVSHGDVLAMTWRGQDARISAGRVAQASLAWTGHEGGACFAGHVNAKAMLSPGVFASAHDVAAAMGREDDGGVNVWRGKDLPMACMPPTGASSPHVVTHVRFCERPDLVVTLDANSIVQFRRLP